MTDLLEQLERMQREQVYKREQAVVDNFNKIMGGPQKKNKKNNVLQFPKNKQ